MSVSLMEGGGWIAEVSTTQGKPTQTNTIGTAGTWAALHCSAGSSQQLLPQEREADAEFICRGGTNYAKNYCFVRELQIKLEVELYGDFGGIFLVNLQLTTKDFRE